MNFFISDHHFGHMNILKYTDRCYSSVKEMDEDYIRKWNSVVSPQDTVYYIGDFSFLSQEDSTILLSKLNGTKILISGNHDRKNKEMLAMGFSNVVDKMFLVIGGEKVQLNHYPFVAPDLEDIAILRPNIINYDKSCNKAYLTDALIEQMSNNYDFAKNFLKSVNKLKLNRNTPEKIKEFDFIKKMIGKMIGKRPINDGRILIHGHTHNTEKRHMNAINVSVDAWDGYPASEEQIKELINDFKKEIELPTDIISKENCKDISTKLSSIKSFYEKINDEESLKKISKLQRICTLYCTDLLIQIPIGACSEFFKVAGELKLFIQKHKLEIGAFYKGRCRNAQIAIWNGKYFYYIRNKWGQEFPESIKCPEDEKDAYDVFIPHEKIDPDHHLIEHHKEMLIKLL